MKTLLVLEDKDLSKKLILALKNLDMSVIHYRDPIKALDNIPELDPDAVVISTVDFPRHWKPLAAAIRAVKDRTSCIIVLIKGPYFSYDEAAKAALLEVNGFIQADLQYDVEIEKILAVFNRYFAHNSEPKTGLTSMPDFVFAHPKTGNLIIGSILKIENSTLFFIPDYPPLLEALKPGDRLPNACIQVKETTLPLSCTVVTTGTPLEISIDMPAFQVQTLLCDAEELIKSAHKS